MYKEQFGFFITSFPATVLIKGFLSLYIRFCFITAPMASTARSFARAALKSTPSTSAFKASARNTAFALPRQTFRQQFRRGYASEPTKSSSSGLYIGIGALALGGAGYYFYGQGNGFAPSSAGTKGIFTPKFEDYQKVYNEVASRLEEKDDYDDGSYGPVLVRLAWHASGTYDVETGTGGSNGATMRFAPEGSHGANAGLKAARDFLEPVKGMCSLPPDQWKDQKLRFACREVPMDHLLRPLDPQRCRRNPRNARPSHSLPTWTNRQGRGGLYP